MTPDEFRKIRKAARKTQAEWAERLGVSRKTIVNWEIGVFPIPPNALDKLEARGVASDAEPPKTLENAPYWLKVGKDEWRRTLAHPFWYLGLTSPLIDIIKKSGATYNDRQATTDDLVGYVAPAPMQAYEKLIAAGVSKNEAYRYLVDRLRITLPIERPASPNQRLLDENAWLIAHGSMAGFHDAHPQYPREETEPTPEQHAKSLSLNAVLDAAFKNLGENND